MWLLVLGFAVILVAVGITAVLLAYGEDGFAFPHIVATGLGILMAIATVIGILTYMGLGYRYVAAEYQAEVLNREYGTHYTREEVLYASSVIETIRQLDRKRYEINGNIGAINKEK